MNIPIPPETPDPNIDDPSLPPPVPEEDPDELPIKPTMPPTVGDPPSQEPPVKLKGRPRHLIFLPVAVPMGCAED